MNLSEKELKELKDKKITIEDLDDQYFVCFKPLYKEFEFDEFDNDHEINGYKIKVEVENISKLLNENICSFQELVDKFKRIEDFESDDPCLNYLLRNEELFKELFENNRLDKDDLRYLLNKIDEAYELCRLCEYNDPLIKQILNEFVLNKETVNRFNILIENDKSWSDWCKRRVIHTVFDLIEYYNKNNEEILKLNELNRKVYLLNSFELSLDQKLELSEVLRNSEQAQNTLIQIIETHLEDQYDFEQLKNILTKNNGKNLKTRFNF